VTPERPPATLRRVASLSLWLYRAAALLVFPVATPWLLVADRRHGKHRPPLRQRLARDLPPLPRGGVWVQAVSVGEVAVARPLLTELRRRRPTAPLVLSATTATGLAMASGQQVTDAIVPYPLDLRGAVRRALDAVGPGLVVLVETELWPEMLAACAARHIPVALVNARVSDRSWRGYRAVRGLLRPLIAPLSLVAAQDAVDAERLAALGVAPERIHVTGNIKFDPPAVAAPTALADAVTRLAGGRPLLIAGSTMAGEEAAVITAITHMPAESRPFLVIAPRHPERSGEALELLEASGLRAARRSLIERARNQDDALVLDTVGELAGLYEVATAAFVGGSLVPTGGHNPIEPARFGVPILTGPHVHNFKAIYRAFVAAGAARTVNGPEELVEALAALFADPAAARAEGERGRALVERHAGATLRTVDLLEPLLA
jgi:3-deoxy-D-manno-octulosonic-acid transferase